MKRNVPSSSTLQAPWRCTLAATFAAALALSAFDAGAQMSERQRGTAKGAGVGAAAGAVLGGVTGGGDRALKGAAVGAALGAVAGNLWSKRLEDKREQMQRATEGTGIEVARTPDNQLKVNVPSDFSFDVGSAQVKPQMRPVLDQLVQGLDPRTRVTVVGHTDNAGSEALNDRLSLERAARVRDYLSSVGVDEGRVIANGRGEHEPLAANDTADGRAQNRRVEIFVSEPERSGG